MKIVIAVDGSECSSKAVRHLLANAAWFRDPELHVLYVQLPIPPGRARAVAGHDAVEDYYRDEARDALAPAEQILQGGALPFRSSFLVGEVPKQIESYVQQNGIDMVVVGSHGHSMLQRLVLGSVATKVLATSSVPVLIVR